MAKYPWCYNYDTPLEQLKEVGELWREQLEAVHSEISKQDWDEIIDSIGREYVPEDLHKRPRKIVDKNNGLYGGDLTVTDQLPGLSFTAISATENLFEEHQLTTDILVSADRSILTKIFALKTDYLNAVAQYGYSSAPIAQEEEDGFVAEAREAAEEALEEATAAARGAGEALGILEEEGPAAATARLFASSIPEDFNTQYEGKYISFFTFRSAQDFGSYNLEDFRNIGTLIQRNLPAVVSADFSKQVTEFVRQVKFRYDFPLNFINCNTTDFNGFMRDYYSEQISKLYIFRTIGEAGEERVEEALEAWAHTSGTRGGPGALGALFALVTYEPDPNEVEALKNKIKDKIKKEVEEAFAESLIFSEQCFMLTNLNKLVEYKKRQPLAFALPYQKNTNENPDLCGASRGAISSNLNQPLLIQGEPFSFMNKMAVEPSQKALFEMMPHQISSLTPNIELFKVVSEEFDGELVEFEIPIKFDINTKSPRVGDVYRSQRGTGVGLKSFKFSYDGTDPFSAKKAITADLSIFASSFTNLLEYRDQDGNTSSKKITGTSYRYTDLALKTGKISKSDNNEDTSDAKEKTLEETFGDEEREQQEKLNFRLKVVVQWAAKPEFIRSIKDEQLKKALYNCAITLYLTPVIHTFDFDDNGGVTFNISYKAYIEDFFANENFNVFSELSSIKQTRDYILDYFKEQNCDLLKGKEFKNFQNFDSQYIINKNRKSFNSIIKGLHDRKLINYINMTYGEIETWMKNPSAFKFSQIPISSGVDTQNTEAIVDEAIKNYESSANESGQRDLGDLRLSLIANSQENQSIPFFYLSDLISVVMNLIEQELLLFDDMDVVGEKYLNAVVNIFENRSIAEKKKIKNYIDSKIVKQLKKKKFDNIEQFKKLRIVLGPMELNTIDGFNSCTLGDVPISVNYFIEFMSDKVIAKELLNYPLSKFIKDVINELIKSFINSEDCSGQNSSQRVSINSTTIVGYNRLENGIDTITDLCLGYLEDPKSIAEYYGNYFQKGVFNISNITADPNSQIFPLIKISGDRNNPITFKNIDMMTNFYVFSVGRTYPADKYVGDRDIDASAGIFHYLLGEDRGIVKNIKLQKTTTPGLKEVRFEQEGYAGLEQLREVYNASIDCYLNPQTFPGTYIYIPPEGFAPDFSMRSMVDDKGNLLDLTKFGIGGYYMITKTTHQISPGQADTTIEASWVASKDGKYGKRTASTDDEKRGEGEGSEKVKKCKISVTKNR